MRMKLTLASTRILPLPHEASIWIHLFNYGQEVEQAILQFCRLNINDFPRWPDEHEMNSSVWDAIWNHLQDAADRVRGLIKLLQEQIDQHEATKAIERHGMDPSNFDKSDRIVVRSYQQHISEEFSWLEHRYRRLVFRNLKRDSLRFQKMEDITDKMYLWSRIEAMTAEYMREINKLDNEIYDKAKERLRIVSEFWSADDLIRKMRRLGLDHYAVPQYGWCKDGSEDDNKSDNEESRDREVEKEKAEDNTPEGRRQRANRKFVHNVGEFIKERTSAEVDDFLLSLRDDEERIEAKIFEDLPWGDFSEELERYYFKVLDDKQYSD